MQILRRIGKREQVDKGGDSAETIFDSLGVTCLERIKLAKSTINFTFNSSARIKRMLSCFQQMYLTLRYNQRNFLTKFCLKSSRI